MVGKEIAVKKYVVRLSAEERAQLDELIRKGVTSGLNFTQNHRFEFATGVAAGAVE